MRRPPERMLKMGKLVKAAVKIGDTVYTGWRHHEIRNEIMREGKSSRREIANAMHDRWSRGFVTEDGTFLPRHQADLHAKAIGQVGRLIGSILTSEDLWDNDGTPIAPVHDTDGSQKEIQYPHDECGWQPR